MPAPKRAAAAEVKVWQVESGPYEGHVLAPGDPVWVAIVDDYYGPGQPARLPCRIVSVPTTAGAPCRVRDETTGHILLVNLSNADQVQWIAPGPGHLPPWEEAKGSALAVWFGGKDE